MGTQTLIYRIIILIMKRTMEAFSITASILQARCIWSLQRLPLRLSSVHYKGSYIFKMKWRGTLLPVSITLVSAVCPISTSPLIQQSNKLEWKRFIVYNSFMRALPMHLDVTALRGTINWLVRASVGRCQTRRTPFAMAVLYNNFYSHTPLHYSVIISYNYTCAIVC